MNSLISVVIAFFTVFNSGIVAQSSSEPHVHEQSAYEYSEYYCNLGRQYRRDWYSVSVMLHYHDDGHYEPGNGYWRSKTTYVGNFCAI